MCIRGLVGSILLLIGATINTPLPDSFGLRLFGGLNHIARTTGGRMLGLAIAIAGVALISWAWLSLLRALARSAAGAARDMRWVRICAVAWSAPLLVAPPLFSLDGWSYAAQGVLANIGLSPYEHGPGWLDGPLVQNVAPRWMFTPAPYGPVSLTWGALGAAITHDPYLLVVWHRLAAYAGLAMLAWAIPMLADWTGQRRTTATAIVIACPLMVTHGIGGLHNDLLAAGIAAAALVIARRSPWLAAGLAGIAAAVKLPAAVVCVGIALLMCSPGASLVRRIGAFVGTAAMATIAVLLSGIPFGLGNGWIHALGVPGVIRTPLSITSQIGGLLKVIVGAFTDGPDPNWPIPLIRGIGLAISMAIVAWLALRARTGERKDALNTVGLCALTLLWLEPVVHVWYTLWALGPVAAMNLPKQWLRGLVMFVLVAGMTAPLESSLAGKVWPVIAAIAMVIAALAPLVWRYWHTQWGHHEDARST